MGGMILKFYIRIELENIQPASVLYMRRTGAYGVDNYKLMDTFKKWVKENGLYNENTVIYAIPLDNPEKTESCRCRYDVCINLCNLQNPVSHQVKYRKLAGGKYLVFLIPHTADAVQTAWKQCFSETVGTGYLLDENRPVMERYRKKLVDNHYCELCVPVF